MSDSEVYVTPGTVEKPRYFRVEDPRSGATPLWLIVCDEGWRESIVCSGMYEWAADWLLSIIGRKPLPLAPGPSAVTDSNAYAPLVAVRQADVPDPVPGSEEVTCIRCGAACWIQPEARQLAVNLFGSDTAICEPCMHRELGDFPECPSCHPTGGARYRSGEDIRQKEDGSLTCLTCGRVVAGPEPADVG